MNTTIPYTCASCGCTGVRSVHASTQRYCDGCAKERNREMERERRADAKVAKAAAAMPPPGPPRNADGNLRHQSWHPHAGWTDAGSFCGVEGGVKKGAE